MRIGFANGDFHRMQTELMERFTDKSMNLFRLKDVAAMELHCYNEALIDYLIHIENFDLSQFVYVSLHMPDLPYTNDDASRNILLKLKVLVERSKIQNIVFHTDKIQNWDVFDDFKELPISIENMDEHKSFGKTVAEVKSILDKKDFKLTLDLQHCFVNDQSLQNALDFQTQFKDRIAEYHISGFDEKFLHYPLFKTKQKEIIRSLKYFDKPIIIESTFDKIGEQKKELDYIIEQLTSIKF
jgi:hypothetical protein